MTDKSADNDEIYQTFTKVTDTPAHIRKWTEDGNHETRDKASLEDENEFDLPSGRHNAEKVLELKGKSHADWSEDDYEFAGRVVNYAKRSAGIAAHHPHRQTAEVGDTGLTKNEIARRNWGLPAAPE